MKPLRPHPAFELLRSSQIETLHLTMYEFEHRMTGARHYHLAADNSENVFLVAFRTVPTDSTGVAHILEHTALCGSERYPVRDPFFMMARRSLNTFMNAFTSSDWTAYPFASQNRKDYFNLLDIYLDSVFFSRLDPLDFAQEGLRLEFQKLDDPASDLTYKGIVYNEMKGDASSPTSILYDTFRRYLFPTSTYHHNSGGNPEHIPDLSYADLQMFYRTHYHPSNAVFMTFGDIEAADLQAKFENDALGRFTASDKVIEVKNEKRYFAPIRVEESYPFNSEQDTTAGKTHLVMGWLLGANTDLEQMLKSHLLADVLLDTSASPLRRALETTNLGTSVSPLCGVDESNHEISFMCGIEGGEPSRMGQLEELVLSVLNELAEEGVPNERVEAVLHQLELQQREIGGDGYPYGLQLILAGLSASIHRGDPIALLDLDPVLVRLRSEIADPDFIKTLIREQLLDNPHRVSLILKPDSQLSGRRERAERLKLERIKSSLNSEGEQEIIDLAVRLNERQRKTEDADLLPKVGLADIQPAMSIPVAVETHLPSGQSLSYYGQATNGLVYQQIVTELPELTADLLQHLPLYTHALTEIGSGGRDYLETQHLQHSITGGFNAFSMFRGGIEDVQQVQGFVTLASKALTRNQAGMSDLLEETMQTVQFDEPDRIRDLISQARARREATLTSSGSVLTMTAAASGLSPVINLNHRLSGLAGLMHLRQLDDGIRDDGKLAALCQTLAEIHSRVVAAPHRLLVVADEEARAGLLDYLQQNWGGASVSSTFAPCTLDPIQERVSQIWTTNTQVSFCAKAYVTVPEGDPDAPAFAVLGGVLRNGFLHGAIREQGGAYGAGASQDSSNAVFRFSSFRDPYLRETLDNFDAAISWLLRSKIRFEQVEEAILGVVSAMDAPGSPAGEARQAFHSGLFGRTPEHRNRLRSEILKVRADDLKRVAEQYLKPELASTAVLTNVPMSAGLDQDQFEVIHL
jgi:hypothetical protein|tara:strand:+ start:4843 stop:7773 length:2931 start_codon:yes stop_codon:yes gene_type:complete